MGLCMNFAALTLALMAQLSNWWRRPASAKPTNPKQSKTLRASEPRHQGVRSRVVTHALSQCNDVSRRQPHTRQIRRNASQAGEQFHVTRHCRAGGGTQRGTRVIGDCCGGVRNSSRTCIREPLTAVWAGTLNSWMMRKSFRFASIALNRRSF